MVLLRHIRWAGLFIVCCALSAQAQQDTAPQNGKTTARMVDEVDSGRSTSGAARKERGRADGEDGNPVRSGSDKGSVDPRGKTIDEHYSDPAYLPDPPDAYAHPRGRADAPGRKVRMPVLEDPKAQALREVLDDQAPMGSEEVNGVAKRLDDYKRAVHNPEIDEHKEVISTVTIELQPNAPMPVVRLNMYAQSSITFIDSTGNPWPIVRNTPPTDKWFYTEFHADNNPHEIGIEPLKNYAKGNLKVFLEGLSTPIMLRLVTGQKETDARLDVTVPRRGPNAAAVIQRALAGEASSTMYSMLNGVVPDKAVELTVEGGDARAWELGDKTYLRLSSRTTVRSPGNTGQMSSLDGTSVYELPARTSVVYAVREGQSMELRVSGF